MARSEKHEAHLREQTTVAKIGELFVRPGVYWLFHSWRLFGYFYILPPLAWLFPKQLLIGSAGYVAIHRQRWWQRTVHRFFSYGASRRHQIVNPNAHLIDPAKRYFFSLHPHSALADGWHSVIARNVLSFDDEGNGPPEIGRKIALCFAPIIQHVPIHQEMYRDRCGGADKKFITSLWTKTQDTDPALIPGGFAESVFANSSDTDKEYCYLKDRAGFLRICIENKKDVVPVYTFGSSRMYWNPPILRGVRSRFSQHYFLPALLPIGKWGTTMPLTDKTTTVVFPPFAASEYTLDQLPEAHEAYKVHLKKYFDEYKDQYGMAGVELVFVGRDFKDDDFVARALRRVGIVSKL